MSTISGKYAKTLIHQQFIKELATETATDVYSTQYTIVKAIPAINKWRKQQITELSRIIQQRNFQISNRGTGIYWVMNYPLEIRLADLSFWGDGSKKTSLSQVYNRVIGGFIFGYFYKMLINGISAQLNEAITQRLRSAGYNIQ